MDTAQIEQFFASQREKYGKKLLNPYIFGVVALFYAYRGKLSKVERFILGTAGAVTMYQNYQAIKQNKDDMTTLEVLQKYVENTQKDGAASEKV
jgi:hypothetical protein